LINYPNNHILQKLAWERKFLAGQIQADISCRLCAKNDQLAPSFMTIFSPRGTPQNFYGPFYGFFAPFSRKIIFCATNLCFLCKRSALNGLANRALACKMCFFGWASYYYAFYYVFILNELLNKNLNLNETQLLFS